MYKPGLYSDIYQVYTYKPGTRYVPGLYNDKPGTISTGLTRKPGTYRVSPVDIVSLYKPGTYRVSPVDIV